MIKRQSENRLPKNYAGEQQRFIPPYLPLHTLFHTLTTSRRFAPRSPLQRPRTTKVSSSAASVSSSSSVSSYSSNKAPVVSLAYSYVPPSPQNVPTLPVTSTTTSRSRRKVTAPDNSDQDHAAATVMALGFGNTMSEMSQEVMGEIG